MPTTEGKISLPPEPRILTSPSTKAATSELVVPRSIPTITSSLESLIDTDPPCYAPLSPVRYDGLSRSTRSLRDRSQPPFLPAHRRSPRCPPRSCAADRIDSSGTRSGRRHRPQALHPRGPA